MTRKSDIEELIVEVKAQLDQIRASYETARSNDNVTSISRPTIKSALEHLRSCLDYCAMDINNIALEKADGHLFFPFGENQAKFEKSCKKNLPGLKESAPHVHDLVLSIQPFKCGSHWLSRLFNLTNKAKHRDLLGQTRSNSEGNVTSVGNMFRVETGGKINILPPTKIAARNEGDSLPLPTITISETTPIDELERAFPQAKVTRIHNAVRFEISTDKDDALDVVSNAFSALQTFIPDLYDRLETLQRARVAASPA